MKVKLRGQRDKRKNISEREKTGIKEIKLQQESESTRYIKERIQKRGRKKIDNV